MLGQQQAFIAVLPRSPSEPRGGGRALLGTFDIGWAGLGGEETFIKIKV